MDGFCSARTAITPALHGLNCHRPAQPRQRSFRPPIQILQNSSKALIWRWGSHLVIEVPGQYALPRGVETPCPSVGVGRDGTSSSGHWPGACDVCPGASVLKVTGPCGHGFLPPGLGSRDACRRGRTADTIQGRFFCMGAESDVDQFEHKPLLRPVLGLAQDLPEKDLEDITVEAIRKHRQLREEAEALESPYVEHPPATGHTVGSVRLAWVGAMMRVHAQQALLSTLLDVLGYIPEVPDERGVHSSRSA